MGGAGPIPWTAVISYAEHEGMSKDEFMEFSFLITSLDSVFLQESRPKGKMSSKSKG